MLCSHLVFPDCAVLCGWCILSGAVKAPVVVTTGTALPMAGGGGGGETAALSLVHIFNCPAISYNMQPEMRILIYTLCFPGLV